VSGGGAKSMPAISEPTASSEQLSPRSPPAFYSRRRKRGNELGQLLIKKNLITPAQLREALQIQSLSGGHLGAILRRIGACDDRAIADALIEQVRLSRGKTPGIAHRARENPSILGLHVPCRPNLTRALLVVGDVLSLALAGGIVAVFFADDPLTLPQRLGVVAILPLCAAIFAAIQLYVLTPPSPPEELRRIVLAVTLVYFSAWIVAVLTRTGSLSGVLHGAWLFSAFSGVSHGAFFLGWLASVIFVPIGRGFLRGRFSHRDWWGQAVVVLGAGKVGRAVVNTLRSRPQLGLKPVAILDDDPSRHGTLRAAWGEDDILIEPVEDDAQLHDDFQTPSIRVALEQFSEVAGIPVLGGLELAPILAQRLKIRSAVIAMPEMESANLLAVIERYAEGYTNVLVIPDLLKFTHFGAPTRDLGGVLGIEVQRQLLLRGPRMAKRSMDLVLTSIGFILILPILAIMALLIKLDSQGSAFYRQKRLGQDGVRFTALKFRTMYGDGEQRLAEVLARDPKLAAEYDKYHKLAQDPRVTRIGKVLRKYSLDELPQLWNVLVGEMSLVGPRPYLEREIPEMNQQEAIILRVKPGITGIWQVTGRNATTFDERIQLDVEYVRNWSPWLDFYVLARTVPVVLGGSGS
jgi:lipopolysaccharide/colanic/teichoic acid biosynthesis glycosyltransferase